MNSLGPRIFTDQFKGRGFTPWWGVFETLRVERGEAQFVVEHAASLRASAQVLGLRVKINFARLGVPAGTGRWRWVVTPEKCWAMFQPQSGKLPRHYSISVSPLRLGSQNWDARHKTLSYLTHWQAREQAKTDEVILLNENGEIASAAMGNVFWVKAGRIYTPALTCGCRAGVIRSQLLKLYPVYEVRALLREVEKADQIFITNSWMGVRRATWAKR